MNMGFKSVLFSVILGDLCRWRGSVQSGAYELILAMCFCAYYLAVVTKEGLRERVLSREWLGLWLKTLELGSLLMEFQAGRAVNLVKHWRNGSFLSRLKMELHLLEPHTGIRMMMMAAEVEVERLDQLKASRMKEIAFKKQAESEEIFARAHIEIDPEAAREKIMALIDSGNIEPAELLADMDNQIAKAKEEALSREEMLDKVEKWMSACEEESWLEDYIRLDYHSCIDGLSLGN